MQWKNGDKITCTNQNKTLKLVVYEYVVGFAVLEHLPQFSFQQMRHCLLFQLTSGFKN